MAGLLSDVATLGDRWFGYGELITEARRRHRSTQSHEAGLKHMRAAPLRELALPRM
jgi:hypothetical protein